MQDSKQLLNQVEQKIARSQKTSPTEAGRSNQSSEQQSNREQVTPSHIDAINQVFALFRINYHNQYHAAFVNTELLNQAKKLWLESLSRFSPEAILKGAKTAIETCEYLPTVHKMIECCNGAPGSHGLPDVHAAYMEACQAPSPKVAYQWSHPAVYYAGRDSDWFFLANNSERDTFPIFKACYQALCERVVGGEKLPSPEVLALPETTETPLSKKENSERMAKMRADLGL
jgi:Replication protein P